MHDEAGSSDEQERTQRRSDRDCSSELADVLARLEELTERLADAQERMDTLLAQMEQREVQLAGAAAARRRRRRPQPTGRAAAAPGFERCGP